MAPCGCCSPTSAQASSERPSSRPGSTTHPCGASAITFRRAAVAGAVPVEPAATSTPCGGWSVQAWARRLRSFTRRSLTSRTPSPASRFGHSLSAISRNRRDTRQWSARSASTRLASFSNGSSSSICRLSRKWPSASAISRAEVAVLRSRPSSRSLSGRSARRVSSKRKRFRGSIAAPRSNAKSPGSKGAALRPRPGRRAAASAAAAQRGRPPRSRRRRPAPGRLGGWASARWPGTGLSARLAGPRASCRPPRQARARRRRPGARRDRVPARTRPFEEVAHPNRASAASLAAGSPTCIQKASMATP